MPLKNRSAYPLYIILGTLVCLAGLSQLNYSVSVTNFHFRKLDILSDLRKVPANEEKIIAVQDTGKLGDAGNTVNLSRTPIDPVPATPFMSYAGILEYTSSKLGDSITPGVHRFIVALKDLKAGKRRKVRIAYFGDSMIEGDLITSNLRDSLQSNFGGAGVGFVPITSVVASFRTTITHTFSSDWLDYHYKRLPPANILLGLSGHTFLPGSNSWVKYTPVKKPRLDKFQDVTVLYGPTTSKIFTINGEEYTLFGNDPVNKLELQLKTSPSSLFLKFSNNADAPLYGVCFERDNGVYVDNFAFRGISGIEMGLLSAQMIRQMQEAHPYDLVVLHYGANVLFRPELTDFSWYQRPMKKVLDSLRHDLPATSFLVIGAADKSYRKTDHYITAPGVAALLKVQHELALSYGTAFWNLFAAMGGENAMVKWVEGDTVLANKDYTHFNREGAAKVGALLYKALMDEYLVQP